MPCTEVEELIGGAVTYEGDYKLRCPILILIQVPCICIFYEGNDPFFSTGLFARALLSVSKFPDRVLDAITEKPTKTAAIYEVPGSPSVI